MQLFNRFYQRLLHRLFGQGEPEPSPPLPGPSNNKTEPETEPEEEVLPVNTEALTSYAVQKEETKKATAEAAAAEADNDGQAPVDPKDVEEKVAEALRTIYDPEIPVNIYELGLIYEIKVEESGMAYVKMTLTSPNCPAAGILPGEVESKARSVADVRDVTLDLVFDPPWNPEMMSEAAKLELGML